jgi:hypothetical protein
LFRIYQIIKTAHGFHGLNGFFSSKTKNKSGGICLIREIREQNYNTKQVLIKNKVSKLKNDILYKKSYLCGLYFAIGIKFDWYQFFFHILKSV